MGGWFEEFKVL